MDAAGMTERATGADAAMQHLLSQPLGEGETVGQVCEKAWAERLGRGGHYAGVLGEVGLRVDEEGGKPVLLLNPGSARLESLFAGTRWAGCRAHLVLRGVAGVSRKLTSGTVRVGGRAVRAQVVPLNLAGVLPCR